MAERFVMVYPDEVRDLGAEAAIVLRYLAFVTAEHPDGLVLSSTDIADGTGLTARAVQRTTGRLRDRGLVTATRADTWDPTLRWTVCAGRAVTTDSGITLAREVAVTLITDSGITPSVLEPLEEPPLQVPQDEQTLLPFLAAVRDEEPVDPVEEEFAGFWRAYPRKVDRKGALAEFRRARRTASVDEIAAGLRAQLPGLEARPMDKRPHARTWLHQERWTEEAEHAAPIPGAHPVRGRNPFLDMAGGDR